MAIKITLKVDRDKVKSAKLETIGYDGQACLLTTASIARLNPDAEIAPTQEMFVEEDNEGRAQIEG